MKKNDLNKIFVKTKLRNTNGKSISINNDAQNLYLNDNTENNVSKKKTIKDKLKSIPQETFSQVENDSEESNLNSESESESETESEQDELIKTNEEIIENAEEDDNNSVSDSETEVESETETETEVEAETETETDANIAASEIVETDNDKDTEVKNEDEECIFEYDDVIDDKDLEVKPYQIPMNERSTDKQLTHYEKVRILGVRAKQIAMGAKVMVKYDQNMSSIELATHELNNKMTPLLLKRPLPNNSYEI